MQRPDPAQMAERRAETCAPPCSFGREHQDAALRAFVALSSRREALRDRMRGGQRQAMAQMTTPQRLEQARARMGERHGLRPPRPGDLSFYAQPPVPAEGLRRHSRAAVT